MIKSELKVIIANKVPQLPEHDVAEAVNHITDLMSNTLSNGTRIEIRGFGSFSLHYRPPRNAHNPKTGEKVITQAKYSPHFKPGKDLREKVNANRNVPIKHDDGRDDEDDSLS